MTKSEIIDIAQGMCSTVSNCSVCANELIGMLTELHPKYRKVIHQVYVDIFEK